MPRSFSFFPAQVPEVAPEHRAGDHCHSDHLQHEPSGQLSAQKVVHEGDEITDEESGSDEKRQVGQPAPDSRQPFDRVSNQFPTDVAGYEQKYGESDDERRHGPAHPVLTELSNRRIREGAVNEIEEQAAEVVGAEVQGTE